jgi:HSP20 family protein
MDRVFEQAWVRPTAVIDGALGRFPVDLYESGDEYVLTASLPGVKPEELDVTIHGSTVTVSYERTRDENTDVTWHARELPYGRFSRQITLPVNISNDDVEAHMEHGLLRLRLPKVAQARERRIEIKAGAMPQIHEASPVATHENGHTNGHDTANDEATDTASA